MFFPFNYVIKEMVTMELRMFFPFNYVIKEMVTMELRMHLGGLLGTQDARVAQFYYFPSSILISLLLHNFIISLPPPHLFYIISTLTISAVLYV